MGQGLKLVKAEAGAFDWRHDAAVQLLGQVVTHSEAPPRVWDIVCDRVSTDDFRDRAHREIYEACAQLDEDGEVIDLDHVLRRLEVMGKKRHEVMVAIAAAVERSWPRRAPEGLLGMVRLVRQDSRLRRTRELGARIVQASSADNPDGVLNDAYEQMLRLATEREAETDEDESTFIAEAADSLRYAGERDDSLRTGLADFDRLLTSGFPPRSMTVIAALTGGGKSALALQVADKMGLQVALGAKRGTVRIVSLEMGRVEQHRRRLVHETGIPMDCWLGRQSLPFDAEPRLTQAVAELRRRPLRITYAGTLSVSQIRSIARRDATGAGLALLVVDYLQLVEAGKGEDSRAQEVSRVAYGLKAIAMDLDAPVIALAQLNRAAAASERPRLSDLRESGGIEQAADNVVFIYQRPKDEANVVTLRVAKQRNGPRDVECRVLFDGARFCFKNLEEAR